MNYIIADKSKLAGLTMCDLSTRKQSTDGRVMLNENDFKKCGAPLTDIVAEIGGTILTEREAMNELNKEEWS